MDMRITLVFSFLIVAALLVGFAVGSERTKRFYKEYLKSMNDDWFKHCNALNDRWFEHCKKYIIELEMELSKIDRGDNGFGSSGK